MEKTTLELFKEYYNEIAKLTINYSTTQTVYPIEAVRAAIDLVNIEMDRQFLLEKQRITEENGKIISEAFLNKMEELKR
jgi:hypothetical protein